MTSQGNTSKGGDFLEGRFVVLRHECGSANGGPAASHWDLMIELPGSEKLVTWQVEIAPADWANRQKLPAKRIDDHRKIYLTYEGDISGNRGSVKRVDAGTAEIISQGPAWRIRFRGETIRAELEISAADSK